MNGSRMASRTSGIVVDRRIPASQITLVILWLVSAFLSEFVVNRQEILSGTLQNSEGR